MKAVEPPSIKYPDEMHKMDKETFFFCKWIDKISTKRRKNRRFLIITDWEFFVLKKKTFSKKLILSYSFRWYDITSVDHDDERPEEFTIRFKNRKNKKKSETIQTIQNNYSKKRDYFTFKYPRTEKMLTKLYSYLNSFHMPQDLPKFNFPTDFPYPNAKGSITDHIRMKLRLRNHRISTSTLNALKKFISNEPSEFSFTEIRGIISFLPIFMECIYLAESIDTLIIPFDTNFNSLKILNDFLPENRNITSLVFKERLPGDFSDFKKTFLSTTATENITSLKFINSNFTDQNVIDISGIVSKRTIKTLHLKNSLGPLTLKPFLQKVYDNPGFQSITNFSLDHTQSIDIRTLMPYLKNVTTLTLIHCEFEIADLFDVLTEDYSMISLNISQNNNDKQIFNIISFPKYLSTIVLRDIKWELLSLSNFIESVMNHRPISSKDEIANNEIKLDLSQIKMSDEDWSSFFIQLDEKQRGSVVSLGWDNNPIDRHFIDFINSFLNLSYLSLNGIIIPKSEDFDSLLRFIANSTTLTALSIHGTELQNLGKNIMAVIDTLYVNRSIRRIDINNHKCGNNMMLKLADVMIQNRVVDEISFCSRNDINDISLFELFFIVVGQYRGKPLYTEFPSSFVKSALQFGSISDKRCEKLKYDYDFMVRGNPSITIPETSIKRNLLKKFSVKNYNNDPTLIDYDDNAKIRRNQIEKKYKFEAKKVQRQDDVDNDENDENDMVDDDFMLEENNEKLNSMKNGKRKRRKSIKRPKNKKTNEKNELQIDKEDENLNSDELEKKEEEEINELPFALSEDEQAIISPQTKSKNKKKKKNKNEEEEANEQLEEEKVETSLAVSINDINAELGNLLLANEEEEAKESKTKNKKSKKASKSTKTHKKEESDELSVPADEESPQNETEDADYIFDEKLSRQIKSKKNVKSPKKSKKKEEKINDEEEINEQFEEEKAETSLATSINDINAELKNLLLANDDENGEEEMIESKEKIHNSDELPKSEPEKEEEKNDEEKSTDEVPQTNIKNEDDFHTTNSFKYDVESNSEEEYEEEEDKKPPLIPEPNIEKENSESAKPEETEQSEKTESAKPEETELIAEQKSDEKENLKTFDENEAGTPEVNYEANLNDDYKTESSNEFVF